MTELGPFQTVLCLRLLAVGLAPCILGLEVPRPRASRPLTWARDPSADRSLCAHSLCLLSAFTQSLSVDIFVWLLPVCGLELPESAGYLLSPGPQTSPLTPPFFPSRPQADSSELWVLTSPKTVQEAATRWVPRWEVDCLGAGTQTLDSVP